MHVKVLIERNKELLVLGLIGSSRIDWGYMLYQDRRWTMHLVPKMPRELLHGDEPVNYVSNHATFKLLDPRHDRLLVCIDGAKELVEWWAFASFPQGREIVNG